MSGALDELTAEEQSQLNQMRVDDAESDTTVPQPDVPRETPPPAREAPPATEHPPEPAEHEPPEPVKPATEAQERPFDRRALEEERRLRKDYEKRLQETERKYAAEMARLEERQRLWSEAYQAQYNRQNPPPQAEPVPDFNTDPAGFIQYGFKHLAERLNRVESGSHQLTEAQRVQQEAQELQNWGTAQEQAFAATKPDYLEAVGHLRRAREGMIRALGHTDPVQVQAAINEDARQLARIARQNGRNFGEMLYDIALQHGYQPGQQQLPLPGGPATTGLPTAMPPQQGNGAAERLARGQQMAQTIGATGAAPRGEVAAAAVANMSERDFEKYMAETRKRGGDAMRNLFGA